MLRLAQTSDTGRISDFTERFEKHLIAHKKAPETIQQYPRIVAACAEACKWIHPKDATHRDVQDWLDRTSVTEEWTPSTYNNKLSGLRSFFRWLKAEPNPTEGIAFHTEPRGEGQRPFTVEEMRAIMNVCLDPPTPNRRDPRRIGAYILSAHTALRKSNILLNPQRPHEALRCGWVDFENREISLPAGAIKPKRKLVLPMDDDAYAALRAFWPKDPGPDVVIFPFWIDNRVLLADMEDANVPRYDSHGDGASWHSWRKGYTEALIGHGTPPRIIQHLLGHASVVTTLRNYTGRSDTQKWAAVEKLQNLLGISSKALAPHRADAILPTIPAGNRPMAPTPQNIGNMRPASTGAWSRQDETLEAVPHGAAATDGQQMRLRGVEPPRGINPDGTSLVETESSHGCDQDLHEVRSGEVAHRVLPVRGEVQGLYQEGHVGVPLETHREVQIVGPYSGPIPGTRKADDRVLQPGQGQASREARGARHGEERPVSERTDTGCVRGVRQPEDGCSPRRLQQATVRPVAMPCPSCGGSSEDVNESPSLSPAPSPSNEVGGVSLPHAGVTPVAQTVECRGPALRTPSFAGSGDLVGTTEVAGSSPAGGIESDSRLTTSQRDRILSIIERLLAPALVAAAITLASVESHPIVGFLDYPTGF